MLPQLACGLPAKHQAHGGIPLVLGKRTGFDIFDESKHKTKQWQRLSHDQLFIHERHGFPGLNRRSQDYLRCPLRISAGRKNVSSRKNQQSKGNRGVVDVPKKLGSLGGSSVKQAPTLKKSRSSANLSLNEEQAIGQVITAQANFMRVLVQRVGNQTADSSTSEVLISSSSEARNLFPTGDDEDSSLGRKVTSDDREVQSRGRTGTVSHGEAALEGNSRQHRAEELELLCVVRNVLKKIGRRVLVGDKVLVTGIDWTEKRGMIEDVVDRTSEVVDPPMANVNQLLLIFSVDQPQIDEKVLSRFLVEVESTDIPFALVLNKVDLVQEKVIHHWQERLAGWGYNPVLCSAEGRIGLSTLTKLLKDKITVILGPSGVGKSSVINALRDQEGLTLWRESEEGDQPSEEESHARDSVHASTVQDANEAFEQLRVGEVSLGSGRGRHTTRHVSLLRVPGGSGRLADSPGFSRPSLARVSSTSLQEYFPEIQRRIDESETDRCGFPNCLHIGDPFCLVGENWDRYPHYSALLEEVRNREHVEKMVLGTKREGEVRYKVGADGVKQAEPKLALKKHRRTSRKQLKQSLDGDLQDEEELEANLEAELEAELEDTESHH